MHHPAYMDINKCKHPVPFVFNAHVHCAVHTNLNNVL